MRFCSLGSGSSGNSTLVEASQGISTTRVLIDCGFSMRELERRLQRAGAELAQIDAVFITHEHGDHIGCALTLAKKHGVPLWMSQGTWHAIGAPELPERQLHIAQDGCSFAVGDLQLDPYAVPHDAREPLQLICGDGQSRLGILTDAGSITNSMLHQLGGCDALLLEFNHDLELLAGSSYPAHLKKRIQGPHGHLSNETAMQVLGTLQHAQLQHVVAAHLSERNNTPSLVRLALDASLAASPWSSSIADPRQGTDWLQLS